MDCSYGRLTFCAPPIAPGAILHDEGCHIYGGVSGNAGLFSNANDLVKLLQMLLNEGYMAANITFSGDTPSLYPGKTPEFAGDWDTTSPGRRMDFLPADYLLRGRCSHTGYTGTCFWIDQDNRLIYIFLSNRVHPTRANNSLASMNIRTRIRMQSINL